MYVRPANAGTSTVYTYQLAGSVLDELLEAAEDDCWPNNECETEWALLRNWAIQTEALMVDEAENLAWETSMRVLASQDLPYAEWVEARGEALKARVRARKLAQANLRYKYGFRGSRRGGLMRRAVQDQYQRWAGVSEDS